MKKSILVMKCLMVMGALFVVSCDTDDTIKCTDPLTGEMSAEETEFTGIWKVVAMEANDALDITDDDISNPSTDVFAQFSDCERDLVYEFNGDRNYAQEQGYNAALCKNKDAIAGTWSLTKSGLNEDVLNFVANCNSLELKIEINDLRDAFTYKSNVRFQDVNGVFKFVSVKFTYERVERDLS